MQCHATATATPYFPKVWGSNERSRARRQGDRRKADTTRKAPTRPGYGQSTSTANIKRMTHVSGPPSPSPRLATDNSVGRTA